MPYSIKYKGKKEYLLVYAELINAARYRGSLTYPEVAEVMGLPLTGNNMGKEVGQLLGEISQEECEQGRPLLSVLVHGVHGLTGGGFFDLARDLGKLQATTAEAEAQFLERERNAVYATWRRIPHPPVV